MKTILLVTKLNSEFDKSVRAVLEPKGLYQLVTITRASLTNSELLRENLFAGLICESEWLNKEDLQFVQNLSDTSNHIPILVLANRIDISAFGEVRTIQNIITLQRPCDPMLLCSIVEKISAHQSFMPEVCPRFITNEPVRLVVENSGLLIPTRMRNFSASGAFLEYRGISLKVGDYLQLKLGDQQSSAKADHLVVKAKVIWVRDGDNSRSPARGVGVQFLDN